ncbi:MAG: hypothetical protein HW421_1289 [Ignavibacteria bacterium]|nr:hypothetical protein [Ignavibacteria bacterium]
MDYNQILNDFSNGEIAPENEESLFLELSANEELRGKFRQLLAIKNSVMSNSRYFDPSIASTASIFSTLGIGMPVSLPFNPIQANSKSPMKSRLFGKYGLAVMSSLATAIIVTALNFAIFPRQGYNPNLNEKGILQSMENTPRDIPEQKSVIKNDNSINKTNEAVVGIVNEELKNNAPLKNMVHIQTGQIKEEFSNEVADAKEIELLKSPVNVSNKLTMEQLSNHRSEIAQINNYQHSPEIISKNTVASDKSFGITLEVRNQTVWNLPAATIAPDEYAKFNNTGLAVFYNLSEKFSFGLDIRQETFFQVYKGVDDLGLNNIYQQQPNFRTYSASVRFQLNEGSTIRPFGQLSIGGNVVGLVTRAMTGISYSPYKDIKLLLGIEFHNLTYQYQKQIFNSPKIGLNYGIAFYY